MTATAQVPLSFTPAAVPGWRVLVATADDGTAYVSERPLAGWVTLGTFALDPSDPEQLEVTGDELLAHREIRPAWSAFDRGLTWETDWPGCLLVLAIGPDDAGAESDLAEFAETAKRMAAREHA